MTEAPKTTKDWRDRTFEFLIAPAAAWVWVVGLLLGYSAESEIIEEPDE